MTVDFDALYRSHYRRVYGLCLRLLGGSAAAEDAAQEVFVRAYKALDRYDAAQPFAGWVLGIASNHCVDLLRRRTREPGLFDDLGADVAAVASEDVEALEMLVQNERGAGLRAAIDALPDRYRVPTVLAYFNECSYDEIAERLGITRNHVGVLLLRARQTLRRALAESDQESG